MEQTSQQRERLLLPSSKSRDIDLMVGMSSIDFHDPQSVAVEQAMSLIQGT
jgi:hypothetical protein